MLLKRAYVGLLDFIFAHWFYLVFVLFSRFVYCTAFLSSRVLLCFVIKVDNSFSLYLRLVTIFLGYFRLLNVLLSNFFYFNITLLFYNDIFKNCFVISLSYFGCIFLLFSSRFLTPYIYLLMCCHLTCSQCIHSGHTDTAVATVFLSSFYES
jgi:hypothetical protein